MKSLSGIKKTYHLPLINLISKAHQVHAKHQKVDEIQVCVLINVKMGGCEEDCSFCSQSSHFKTFVKPSRLLSFEKVIEKAEKAVKNGATRLCLSAAQREIRSQSQFEQLIHLIRALKKMHIEICLTLGFLTEAQAKRLEKEGIYAYNHNLQTSKEHYSKIVFSHTFEDRLKTIHLIKNSQISLCSGGIIGLGEKEDDRILLIHQLSQLNVESLPINFLEAIPGTPLELQKKISFWDALRFIATARIVMPKTILRLSSGRQHLTDEQQALCFFAGINAIFSGDTLLTVSNTGFDKDFHLFDLLGLKKKRSNCR